MLNGAIKLIISSSVLILAIIAIRALFKNGISRRLRYGLWLIVLLRLIIPINLFSSPVSVMNSVGTMDNITSNRESFDIVDGQQNSSTETTSLDFNGDISNGQTKTDQAKQGAKGVIITEQIILLIWLLGLIITAIYFTAANWKLWKKLRKRLFLDHIQGEGVGVYLVEMDDSPCLFGLFNPSIYLSPKAIEDKQRLIFILAHELAHYRHFDYIWSFARIVLLCVYWYNPLVWIAAWLSKIDCEEACDEAVVKELGAKKRIEYGRTLVEMIPLRSSPRIITASTSMSTGKKAIRKRISSIAANKKPVSVYIIGALLLTVFAAGCTFSDANDDSTPTELESESQPTPVQSETPQSPIQSEAPSAPVQSAVPSASVQPETPSPSTQSEHKDASGKLSEPSAIFSQMPSEFVFSSGAGGWATILNVASDGTFTGEYYDYEMGDTGTDYPNGVKYECKFSGKFTNVEKINELEYSMKVEYIVESSGTEYIEDGFKIITSSDPYGFDNANIFRLYLPGKNTGDLPEGFLNWANSERNNTTLSCYGLYNVSGEQGFVGY